MTSLQELGVGKHIPKQKTYLATLTQWIHECNNSDVLPAQLFTGSPKSYQRKCPSDHDLQQTSNLLHHYNIPLFIHSIYLINFCRPPHECQPAFDYFRKELKLGRYLGSCGVVIHCGKHLKKPLKGALDTMYQNLCSLSQSATVDCPILLETPAGQGTEILFHYKEFSDFYRRFTPEERHVIKICIDTCHVFAAGHDPLQYLQDWMAEFPQSLSLVHFNDSLCERHSRKDRHAFPGTGHIGISKMTAIAVWCQEHHIPMVYE